MKSTSSQPKNRYSKANPKNPVKFVGFRELRKTDYGRSALDGLNKLQVVDLIVTENPSISWAQIKDLLAKRKGRIHKLRLEQVSAKYKDMVAELMKLPKDILVDLSYELSDTRLNRWYRQEHQTVPDDDHDQEIDKKSGIYALKTDRPIELDPKLCTWEKQWQKRKKRGFTVKFKRSKPKAKKAHKAVNDVVVVKHATKRRKAVQPNWLAALKAHNAEMRTDRYGDDYKISE